MTDQKVLGEAIQHVQDMLKEAFDALGHDSDGEVTIVRWLDGDWGLRIAEVGWSHMNGDGTGHGFAFMQSDLPHGLAVCAQTERLLITMIAPEADMDEQKREAERLLSLVMEER